MGTGHQQYPLASGVTWARLGSAIWLSVRILDSHMTDLNIWRSANILLKRYRADAMLIATQLDDALLDQGDVQGHSAWILITRAIADLERKRARSNHQNCFAAQRSRQVY